ncbi:hypothetical protein RHSIM_Rhsim04G0004900 [Rhododendron simsii]|uniref:Uncharacterized protein n=1 Tax=Rhododendron simsii TaxID=118357 RepID=A0A834LR40_RHOSS|nr:hypothetical protein RHSIM_Rhsim04G0004900 [Rhododendron simsii]
MLRTEINKCFEKLSAVKEISNHIWLTLGLGSRIVGWPNECKWISHATVKRRGKGYLVPLPTVFLGDLSEGISNSSAGAHGSVTLWPPLTSIMHENSQKLTRMSNIYVLRSFRLSLWVLLFRANSSHWLWNRAKTMGRKQKIVLPPELPPEISEDEVEVSDEDLQFVNENRDYAGFVSNLDTHSITRFSIFLTSVSHVLSSFLYLCLYLFVCSVFFMVSFGS